MRTATLRPTSRSTARQIWLVILVAILTITASGCRQESRWDKADQSTKGERATSKEAVPGSTLNQFFPVSDEAKITFTQEKLGFAQADLELDGQKVATLSISDTANNPDALTKFENADGQLDGYPLATVGSKGTAVLVGKRFQVQIRSVDANFDRESWLSEFDLAGLSAHK
jgi:hypothetical protein